MSAADFTALSAALAEGGFYRPVLVIDRDRLDANAGIVRNGLAPGRALRLVDKSLPSLQLLGRLMDLLGTRKVMTFHLPIAENVLLTFPDADLLFGKPIPAEALRQYFATAAPEACDAMTTRVVHLVDSLERLQAYHAIAQGTGRSLRIAFEVDVGLHRGGFADPDELGQALAHLRAGGNLSCEGIMGYEAHIHSVPGLFGNERAAVARRFSAFCDLLAPRERTILNTGGSHTVLGYDGKTAANEFSMGSGFLLPTDFEGGELAALLPALFIATPILKTVEPRLPGPAFLTSAMQAIGKFPRHGCFLYGGKWMAKPVYPPGMRENMLWGLSSNQQFMGLDQPLDPRKTPFAFFRQTQSEAVLQQFGPIAIYSAGRIVDSWAPLPAG
jgi:D-serine deaminase-like pyridoxal phosphate-dependent protein